MTDALAGICVPTFIGRGRMLCPEGNLKAIRPVSQQVSNPRPLVRN